jgi:hypothetical protein
MEPIMHTDFWDKTYLEATICPLSLRGKGPYIFIEHTTIVDEHQKTSYADGLFINYCPICGRKLVD